MPDNHTDAQSALTELLHVIDSLLGPGGCPWDKEQTPLTLCDYILEEAYELVEAIRTGDTDGVAEELGDVMFLLLFVSRLHQEHFSLADVLSGNAAKMIDRHPHVFGDATFKNREELLRNWERIKKREKEEQNRAKGLYDSLPTGLPPLLKAYRIHSKAARFGFTWDSDEAMEQSLKAEWKEWEQAKNSGDQAAREEEFGDFLFSLVEYGRRNKIKANAALETSNRKFLARFEALEQLAAKRGLDLASLSLDQMNQLWDEVKAGE